MEYAFFVAFAIYLAPWLVAESRRHPRAGRILALNLLAGWTLVGWAVALGWARRERRGPPALPTRPVLRLVPPGAERGVAVTPRRAWALAAAALLLAVALPLPAARRPAPGPLPSSATRAAVALRAEPQASAATVGRLPEACPVAMLAARAGWTRVWRTRACAGASGRASGWLRVSELD